MCVYVRVCMCAPAHMSVCTIESLIISQYPHDAYINTFFASQGSTKEIVFYILLILDSQFVMTAKALD